MGEPARHTKGPSDQRTTARRLTRALRSTALLTGALALLGTAIGPAAAAGGTPPSFATASPDSPAVVTISAVQQPGAAPGDPLTVTGTVTNTGNSTLKSPQLGLALGQGAQPLRLRGTIAGVVDRGDPGSSDGTVLKAPVTTLGDLPPGASAAFALPQVAQSDLKLPKEGVYELAVEVEAGNGDDSSAHPVGIGRTLLPYYPGGSTDDKPTQVATLWPLTHAPELVAQTMQDSDQTPIPVLRDDSLATELQPDGRLDKLVTLGSAIPSLTWVIDPDLLDAVYAMTKPYRVQLPGQGTKTAAKDTTSAGTGQAAATKWLEKLRQAVTKNGDEVVALPYGDPDLASIAHNGGNLAGLSTAIGKAQQAGQLTVEGRLSVDPQDDVAWPYQGYLDPQTAQVAQQLGGSRVIVNSASVTDPHNLNYSANAARPLPNGQTAVVADSTIADVLQSYNPSTPGADSAAEQRLLAETLAVTLQQPYTPRTLVVMPPRNLSAAAAQVLQQSLLTARTGQWINPVSLDTVTSTPADPNTDGTAIAPADSYPSAARRGELPTAALAQVDRTQQDMDQLLPILTIPTRVSGPFGAAMLRSVSTAWRGAEPTGGTYRNDVEGYLSDLQKAVGIPNKTKITLAGDSGVIQVSVHNDLQQAVTNLQLRLTSSQPHRVNVSKPQDIVLNAAQSASSKFFAQAQGNGPVQMTAQLYSTGPNPQPYGPEVKFTVEVSQVPSGVWWVVGAGAALVLLAGLRFYLQRRKRRGEQDEDPDAPLTDPDAPDGGANDGSEDGSDGLPGSSVDGIAGGLPGGGPGTTVNPYETDSWTTAPDTTAHP
ncbi:DUF6049 family protein [Kitasatospora sp. NBC_01287]|uniref:DUF6049 family protein n=1 Tax=Kitasatospora sp. NBC_01287 TaxID=2903573 RepID=UPI002259C958|nr:DUF6049 family protein [Kitasatospora sp. NBC_01287]MCX4747656.1 DUF6049 family protein [Kitasatospora sp. NBC_01287]